MIPLPLVWTLLTASFWTCGSSPILIQEPTKVLYPKILSNETIVCECELSYCESVYWFRSILNNSKIEFLGKGTKIDRVFHVKEERFKLSKRGGTSFALRIFGVTEADAGFYSCVLQNITNGRMWRPGTLLRPGVTPPTSAPKVNPKPPVKTMCRCSAKKYGCGPLVLWPLVGLISGLALGLICTLYYFSRLPKKCRHQFMKKRHMT